MSEVIYCDKDSLEIVSDRQPRHKRFITSFLLPRLKGFKDKYFWLQLSGRVFKWCGPFRKKAFENKTYEIGLTDLEFPKDDVDYEFIYQEYVNYFERLRDIEKTRIRMNDALRDYKESVKSLSLDIDSLFDSVETVNKEVKKMDMMFALGTTVPRGNA